MKIDRLLSVIMFLLNRDLVSARELAEHFEVSARTIQRDMDALCSAGIPIASVQGSHGGFGIIEGYKLDRQLINTNDLFFMLTSLESISTTLKNKQLTDTVEKIKALAGDFQIREIESQKDKLFIDFSSFSIGKHSGELFGLLEQAIDRNRLLIFNYTDSSFKVTEREIEPMTIVFKWFSWYLFGYCRLRDDYRLFRLSRMENIRMQDHGFERRDMTFQTYCEKHAAFSYQSFVNLTLKFHPSLKIQIEDYFRGSQLEQADDGSLIARIRMPEDDWILTMILGYGDKVEILEPARYRELIRKKCLEISKKYQIQN